MLMVIFPLAGNCWNFTDKWGEGPLVRTALYRCPSVCGWPLTAVHVYLSWSCINKWELMGMRLPVNVIRRMRKTCVFIRVGLLKSGLEIYWERVEEYYKWVKEDLKCGWDSWCHTSIWDAKRKHTSHLIF